jgi:hypothetical protein
MPSDSDTPFTEALVHPGDLHLLHNVMGLPTLIHPPLELLIQESPVALVMGIPVGDVQLR